jgi:hypothetical protein
MYAYAYTSCTRYENKFISYDWMAENMKNGKPTDSTDFSLSLLFSLPLFQNHFSKS